jgi:enoyl-[acyl-carrier protein] reductase II
VVAAGGICDGRGLVAALALGAEGISMGSRFIATQESPVPQNVKQKILEATEEDTVVTRNFTGVRCRVLRNRLAEQLLEMEKNLISARDIMGKGVSRFRKAFFEGDVDWGSMVLGQVCGRIDDIPTCQELIDRVVTGAEGLLTSLEQKVNGRMKKVELKSLSGGR